jgi:hypothetical protein
MRALVTVAAATLGAFVLSLSAEAGAQVQFGGQASTQQGVATSFNQQPHFPQPQQPVRRERTRLEIGALYATSVAYGVGLGVWVSAEAGFDDPGIFLIPPAVLGVAAPVGVYFFDRPKLKRGVPSAVATGALIGAGEGLGIWSYQHVSASDEDEWSFKTLARVEALSSTLGAAGGLALGYLQAPSPKSSLLMSSSVVWGTAIGSMFGYGATSAGQGYGKSNDGAALGGLIGFNVGLAASAGLSTVYIPSYKSLGGMWLGAGLGFAASLPIYLLYARDGGPPAKRGLIFSGVATTLGIGAGAVFTWDSQDSASRDAEPRFARVHGFVPFMLENGAGLSVAGELQ